MKTVQPVSDLPGTALSASPVTADGRETDESTRERVARSILEHGPSTAVALAERLGLTPAAIRRHLDVLVERVTCSRASSGRTALVVAVAPRRCSP